MNDTSAKDLSSIGQRIKKRRKDLGLTQMMIQEQTGISSGNLSGIERGDKLPSAPAIIRLSEILHCSTDWILKGIPSSISDSFSSLEELSSKDKRLLHIMEMYTYIDEVDQKEIEILLEFKHNLREKQNTMLLSKLLFDKNKHK